MSVYTVVKSCAGRDKNGLYIVVGKLDYPYVWIADGRKYSLDKPKKKNCRHLQKVGTNVFDSGAGSLKLSNEWIRAAVNQARMKLTREDTHV
ncbi:KOW domain-containing RNA-binding protein [uncultured Megasphaera sp.]|uniref:KOW domain-containing RNA-binding protein n=1 Tax=uncultured Megasphaera sp. TaxID=165188 RepID=UPI00265AB02F|nr:KOW domain-containing RNA-binding protein [uncultured Megasphaera sp.]